MGDTAAPPSRRVQPWQFAVVAAAVLAATIATTFDWRLAVPLGVVPPLLLWVALVDQQAPLRRFGSTPGRPLHLFASPRTLAWTWAALVLTPGLRVISQDSRRYGGEAASGNLTVDNLFMLVASGVALLVVAFALQRGWPGRVPALAVALLGFAGFAFASTVWSALPLYSFGRGVQYVVLAAFTAYCASRCMVDRTLWPRLLDHVVAVYVPIVLALAAWGLLTHGFADRFQWPGTHPNACASFMALGVLLVLLDPRRARVLAPLPWIVPIAVLVPLVLETGARGYSATMIGAGLVAAVVLGLRDARTMILVVGLGLVAIAVTVHLFPEQVMDFVYRGQTTEEVVSLNGRVEAWRSALANPVGSEVWGVGLGANQRLVSASWNPFNAHSAWIDLLQSLGVVGVSLMATVVLGTVVLGVLRRSPVGAALGLFVLVSSITSSTIAVPDAMAGVLGLAVVATASAPHARTRAPAITARPPVAVRQPTPVG